MITLPVMIALIIDIALNAHARCSATFFLLMADQDLYIENATTAESVREAVMVDVAPPKA